MNKKAEQTTSLWTATADIPAFPKLMGDIQADVCIVGAGIAGLTTAYLLTMDGKSVVVLDDGPVGGGMTGQTSAHLSSALDDHYFHLESLHGADGAKLAAESHSASIRRIEQIVEAEGIDCGFERVDAYLFVPPGDSTEVLDKELEAARKAGLEVEHIANAPIKAYDTGPCIRYSNQAQIHPLKYIAGLAKAITKYGGQIFTDTHVTQVNGGEDGHVETEIGAVVMAKAIVVATNSPINNRFVIHTKQAPYLTYVIAARMPKGSATKALYYDSREEKEMPEDVSPDSYHYVRVYSEDQTGDVNEQVESTDWLIVGGRDHKTGQGGDAEKRYAHLENWARMRWPLMEGVEFAWSGQVMEPVDGLAFIGPNPMDDDNVYIITGDSGNGLTHGTIGGMMLTDMIMGRTSPWQTLYDPNRITLKAAGEFLSENLNVAGQYIKDFTSGSEVESIEEIRRGAGAVIRKGLKKIAVYKDEAGTAHYLSAICPHLGCVVAWNANDKSWDCPCHGSRFDCLGMVINGPANTGLETTAEIEQEKIGDTI